MLLSFALYRSRSKRRIDEKLVVDILAASARNNPNEGLTGFLHTDQDCFLQYLEGPPGPLFRLLARIAEDRRHTDFQILAEGELEERLFPDWDMGQINKHHMPREGLVAAQTWLSPDPDIDALPLIRAFAMHGQKLGGIEISEVA
ncbi:MAG TPA: hypothetical protein DEA05_12355 [Rhodobacteraceae bacterium]|nr:hypothetical protein [Paracoccaceae bacterium]